MLLRCCVLLFCALASPVHAEIYKWVDEHGVTHFGDKPTAQVPTQQVTVEKRKNLPLELNFIPVEYQMASETRRRTSLAIRKIREIYLNHLGMELSSLESFNIRLFGQQRGFQHYLRRYYPGVAENSNGVYSSRNKETVVWANDSFKRMLKVITHEMSHALFDTEFKGSPHWLNEGMAEYVEIMDVIDQGIYIGVHRYWLDMVQRHKAGSALPPLKDYLSMTNRQWRAFDNSNNGLGYAIGWSLCFYLMSQRNTEYNILPTLIKQVRQQGNKFNSIKALNKNYPGGIQALEQNWLKWLDRNYISGHSY